jgi:type VI secretion system secreted protein Hcp
VLTVRKAGQAQQEYIKMKLSDVLISSYMIGGTESEEQPVDTFALNFVKLSFDYFAQKSDGSLDVGTHAGWDLKKNVKV